MSITNQAKALYSFFSGFDIPAYINGDIEVEAEMPYLTYQLHLGRELSTIQVFLYYRDYTYEYINEKAEEIINTIGEGLSLPISGGGAIYIYLGSPALQNFIQEDNNTKCYYLNLYMRILN